MKITAVTTSAPCLYHFTVEADAQELAIAAQEAYDATKEKFVVSGYQGKVAPREAIEAKHGNIFYCDGFNNLLTAHPFDLVIEKCAALGLSPLSMPEPTLDRYDAEGCAATLTIASMPEVTLGCYQDEMAFFANTAAEFAQAEQKKKAELALLNKIVAASTIRDLAPVLEEEAYQEARERLHDKLHAADITLEKYLAQLNISKETFETHLRKKALQTLRTNLVLLAIAKQEKLTVSAAEVKEYIAKDAPKRRLTVEAYQALIPAYKVEWFILVEKAGVLLLKECN